MLANRVSKIAASPTLAMGKTAKEMIAAGEDVVNLSQGEPDFQTPDNISEAAIQAINSHQTDFYTATSGLSELKTAIANRVKEDYDVTVAADQIAVTTGAKLALFTLMQVLINPGDSVVTPAPFWVSYSEQVKLAGGSMQVVQTEDSDFKITIEQLEQLEQRPKLLILNTPNNPSGAVYTADELQAIVDWTKEHDIYLLVDEIYGKLVYGQTQFHSVLELADLKNTQVIVINGVSKAYAMTGWRIGWALADSEIIQAMNKILGHLTSNPTVAAQYAAIEALNGPQDSVAKMKTTFENRLNYMHTAMLNISNISIPFKPEGSFYIFFKVNPDFMKEHGYQNTNEVSMALLKEQLVAVPSGEGFGMPGYLRLSYAKSEQDLTKAIQRFKSFFTN
ncbi:Aspartate/methionine/tyrosine aminotransferase (AspB) [Fructobacillus tropaeoli]|uniref:pyridoxal phosphate-dependent aminotransferase n=1 Tax=Fructobacillus tropaeoli TaxID=709323 RepID=UPI002D9B536A|nr:Aspartate/methionine/tyrosine aminotransferase (AspB) [Fructobacillus tropaeoli]